MARKLTSRRGRDVLFEELHQSIETGKLKAGDRIAPLRELAFQYDISYCTVRTVIQDLEAIGLVRREPNKHSIVLGKPSIHKNTIHNDTLPDSTLGRAIYVLYSTEDGISSPLVNQLTCKLFQHGLSANVISGRPDDELEHFSELLGYWRKNPPYAVINCHNVLGLQEAIVNACGKQTRCIAVGWHEKLPDVHWHQVDVDYQHLGKLAADYLVSRGHRRIAMITHARNMDIDLNSPYSRKSNTGHTQYILAVGRAMREQGMRHALTMVYQSGSGPLSDTEVVNQRVAQICQCMNSKDKPTAFIGEDFRMGYVLRAARQMDLVAGKDFEMLGLGQTHWTTLLGLTSIDFRTDMMAQNIIQLIELPGSNWGESALTVSVQPRLAEHTDHKVLLNNLVQL